MPYTSAPQLEQLCHSRPARYELDLLIIQGLRTVGLILHPFREQSLLLSSRRGIISGLIPSVLLGLAQ